ncbi:MAG TPA: hypothetical protein VIX84_06085, partial [Acidimicrobiales bacterium]
MATSDAPVAQPVGHLSTQVNIAQRPALALNGWLGVLVTAAAIYGAVLTAQHAKGLLWLPIIVAVL